MSSRRRKAAVTKKVVETEETDETDSQMDTEEDVQPKASVTRSAAKDVTDNGIPEDLPEGTVIVQPEAVVDESSEFSGPEFRPRKKTHSDDKLKISGLDLPQQHCTACKSQIANIKHLKRHPALKVLICKRCFEWYSSDAFDQDSNGVDEQCRWCGEGGNLICCDFCHNAFCKACIRSNLGRAELSEVVDAGEDTPWKCYVCHPIPLASLISKCTAILGKADEIIKKHKEEKEKKKGREKQREEKTTLRRQREEKTTPRRQSVSPNRRSGRINAQTSKDYEIDYSEEELEKTVDQLFEWQTKFAMALTSCRKQIRALKSLDQSKPSDSKRLRDKKRCLVEDLTTISKKVGNELIRVEVKRKKIFKPQPVTVEKVIDRSSRSRQDSSSSRSSHTSSRLQVSMPFSASKSVPKRTEEIIIDDDEDMELEELTFEDLSRVSQKKQKEVVSKLEKMSEKTKKESDEKKKDKKEEKVEKKVEKPFVAARKRKAPESENKQSKRKDQDKEKEQPNNKAKKDLTKAFEDEEGDKGSDEDKAEKSKEESENSDGEAKEKKKKGSKKGRKSGSEDELCSDEEGKKSKEKKKDESEANSDDDSDDDKKKKKSKKGEKKDESDEKLKKKKGGKGEDESEVSSDEELKKSEKGDKDDSDDDLSIEDLKKKRDAKKNAESEVCSDEESKKTKKSKKGKKKDESDDELSSDGEETNSRKEKDKSNEEDDKKVKNKKGKLKKKDDDDDDDDESSSEEVETGKGKEKDKPKQKDDPKKKTKSSESVKKSSAKKDDREEVGKDGENEGRDESEMDMFDDDVGLGSDGEASEPSGDLAGAGEEAMEIDGEDAVGDEEAKDKAVSETADEEKDVETPKKVKDAKDGQTPKSKSGKDKTSKIGDDEKDSSDEFAAEGDSKKKGKGQSVEKTDKVKKRKENEKVEGEAKNSDDSSDSSDEFDPFGSSSDEGKRKRSRRKRKTPAKKKESGKEAGKKKEKGDEGDDDDDDNEKARLALLDMVAEDDTSDTSEGGSDSSRSKSQRNRRTSRRLKTTPKIKETTERRSKRFASTDSEAKEPKKSKQKGAAAKKDAEKKSKKDSAKRESDSSNFDSELENEIDRLEKNPGKKQKRKAKDKDGMEEKSADKKKGRTRKAATPKKREKKQEKDTDDSSSSESEGEDEEEASDSEENPTKKDSEMNGRIHLDLDDDENDQARMSLLAEAEGNGVDDESGSSESEEDSTDEKNKKKKKDKKSKKSAKKSDDDNSEDEEGSEGSGKKRPYRSKLLRMKLDSENSSDSDSDVSPKKKKVAKQSKRRKKGKASDSEVDWHSDSATTDSESESSAEPSPEDSDGDSTDSDVVKKKKKKKKGRGKRKRGKKSSDYEDDSDDGPKKKKKRRRIKQQKDSSDADSDDDDDEEKKKRKKKKKKGEESEAEQSGDDGADTPKGRKKIRRIMKDKKLDYDTKAAARAERERRQRVEERQAKYNHCMIETQADASSPTKCPITTKLVLELDKKTEEPVIEVDKKLIKLLKPHQVEAVQFMWDCVIESVEQHKKTGGAGCLLAHCMGLGKTLSVITFVHTLLNHGETLKLKTCLVVCPLNTVLNWEHEWDKWFDDEDERFDIYELSHVKNNHQRMQMVNEWQETGGVLIIGYQMFRNLAKGNHIRNKKQKKAFVEGLLDPGPDIVVCDEGHILKNEKTALSKTFDEIQTGRRIVLTGTPLQNNLSEYHCMANFVKPNLLGTKKEFCNRFVNPITNGQHTDSTPRDVRIMKKRSHVLHEMLAGCVQRKDYGCLTKFLPPKFEYVISVRLSPVQAELYQAYLDLNVSFDEGGRQGARLFKDYQTLMRIWTHPWVMKLHQDRVDEKAMLEDDESDFLDDDSYSEASTPPESSDSDSDVIAISDNDNKKDNKASRSSRRRRGSTDEIVNKWKSSTRGGDPGACGSRQDSPSDEVQKNDEWWSKYVNQDDQWKYEVSGKLVVLFEILRMADEIGDKVLVFSQSILSLNIIEGFLNYFDDHRDEGAMENDEEDRKANPCGNGSWVRGADYFRLDGTTNAQMRKRCAESFNDIDNPRARLFLISTRAGSLGINLVAGNRVVIFDASWNPSYDTQSMFRVYRFGQTKPVYIYRLLAQGTMEEKIYERQVTKQSLSQRVVDEHQIERHFSSSDLRELYVFKPDKYDPEAEAPTPILPKDRFLADILQSKKEWILQYHHHDSLLENIDTEKLSEEDRKAAWEEYEAEKKGQFTYYNAASTMGTNQNPALMQALMQQGHGSLTELTSYLQNPQILNNMMRMILQQNPNLSPLEVSQRLQALINMQLSTHSSHVRAQQELHQQQMVAREQHEAMRLQQINEQRQLHEQRARQREWLVRLQNEAALSESKKIDIIDDD